MYPALIFVFPQYLYIFSGSEQGKFFKLLLKMGLIIISVFLGYFCKLGGKSSVKFRQNRLETDDSSVGFYIHSHILPEDSQQMSP